MAQKNRVTYEFHISRKARDDHQFDESIFTITGNVIFANFRASRVFAQKMNQKRDLIHFPEKAVKAGQINAMGLIDEILHFVVGLYREEINTQVLTVALKWLDEKFGQEKVDHALHQFTTEFPPIAVYRKEIDVDAYLRGATNEVPHRQVALEEMLLLWLANMNPAFSPYAELFEDTHLDSATDYRKIILALKDFFDSHPPFGPDHQNLIDMLRSPAIAVPHSLPGQLEYIRQRWGVLLGRFLYRLLGGLDLIREEEKMRFLGPAILEPHDFRGMDAEFERYSKDRDWMPRVVMLAKSTYVWLDQLSKKYNRPINHLAQVPDEELDTLARWGFTSLWLIGLWERSKASKRIKQLCGNPEAVASAYSLYDYQIASDLGGEEAFQNLKTRAWARGIRLAGDMVPNHVGIDGKWLIEHPNWFIALDYSPYPSHSYNGPDLSEDERVGIFIEDHYYSRNDASVVFRRLDRWTGTEKFVYHGNDGTSMPWNDTAQLNYLNPEVREGVIQTILHVAKKFPIIRFDAAMTLTKRHYQRLWYPQPGTGGDIPTRSEHGLDKSQFDAAMPQEFWREVVDRVAQEMPDTLLLAEAFWLMEGYFVRTLGMHRVYNSAFMNMLKNEENAKYRASIKNVLEFDPEILKRFVNFMNNPDEDTAVAQFGKDDKYIGVCMMMVTMPGLPMFGHGQIEGFTEKYGMEYRKAYWAEQVDENLVRRHEREIFPLMHQRQMFSDVKQFLLYDFFAADGRVNENVFAYSNRVGDKQALIAYHNKYEQATGWIRTSVAYSIKTEDGDNRQLIQKTLGEGLNLHYRDDYFCIFRDHLSGLEYLRNNKELHEKGLYIELGAYKYHVFLDFREVQDNIWHHYANLAAFLNGRGVPNIEEALRETFLQPIHLPFKELVNAWMFRRIIDSRIISPTEEIDTALLFEVDQKIIHLLEEIKSFTAAVTDEHELAYEMRHELEALLKLSVLGVDDGRPEAREYQDILDYLMNNVPDTQFLWSNLLGWWVVHSLGKIINPAEFEEQSRSWIDEWLFGKVLAATFQELGLEEPSARHSISLIKLLTSHQHWYMITNGNAKRQAHAILEHLVTDDEVQQFIRVNRYENVLWFNKESFEQLLWWLMLIAVLKTSAMKYDLAKEIAELKKYFKIIQQIHSIQEESGYRLEKLLNIINNKNSK